MIQVEKLADGVTLATELMPTMSSVAIGIWVRTGAVNERDDINGISHFIEHMMFKGTEKRSAAKIAEDMDMIGGQMNAFTGKEVTCYYIKTLDSNLEKGMEILFDMFTGSVFDEEEMEREKRVIYEEMKMIKDTPDEDAHDTIGELLFRNGPLGRSIIGTEEVLSTIDRKTLTEYLKTQYARDSIVIAVAGKFDKESVKAMVQSALEDFAETKTRPDIVTEAAPPDFVVKNRDIEQSHLCMGTRAVGMDVEEYYTYSVLNCLMGGTMSSRLFQNVRERKGLAYSVYSSMNPYSTGGYYNIYAGVGHDKVEEAVKAIKGELSSLAEKGVTDLEIQKAKEQIKSSFIFGQESVNGRMVSIGRAVSLLGRAREQEEILRSIDAVDREKIQTAIETIADISAYSAVLVTGKDVSVDLKSMIQS